MPIEQEKSYCPYCEGLLKGDTHKHPLHAWNQYNCEFYISKSDKKPILERVLLKKYLKQDIKERQEISDLIRDRYARLAQIEQL